MSAVDFLSVESPNRGSYFVWRHRFLPGKEGQSRVNQIVLCGFGLGQWTVKQAGDQRVHLARELLNSR